MTGYYLMERGWQDHPLFEGDEYSRRDAWEWLIANANFTDRKKSISGKIITLKRGQLSYSIRFLAERWGWHRAKVDRFISRLKTETMIETGSETGQNIITICNYDDFQITKEKIETELKTQSETASRQHRDSIETNNKEGNKEYINKQTREIKKQDLENLVFEDIDPWLLQQETRGSPITIDVRLELERFKTHFLSYGGKDKNGNIVLDWIPKFANWLLEQQKRETYGVKNEKNTGYNERQGVPATSSGSGSRLTKIELARQTALSQTVAEFEARG